MKLSLIEFKKIKSLVKEEKFVNEDEKFEGTLKEMYLEIWDKREHECINCKAGLGDEPLAVYFSHKRSKGAEPKLKMVKSNIELNCDECHKAHEWQGEKAYNERKNLYLSENNF